MRWTWILVLAACNTADAAPKVDGLAVTYKGKRVAMKSAVAVDEGDGTVSLRFTSFPHTCKEELEHFRQTYPDELEIQLRINRRIEKDGGFGWGIRGTYVGDLSSEKQDGTEPLPGATIDASAGGVSKVTLDLKNEDLDGKVLLLAKGKAEIVGCGVDPSHKVDAPPVPQKGAFLEIAGKQLPISGAGFATKGRSGGPELLLSTGPVTCSSGSQSSRFPDASVALEWTKDGVLASAILAGTWVDGWLIRQNQDVPLTATPSKPPAAKEATVAIGGTTTIAGYKVTLVGTVKATVCTGT